MKGRYCATADNRKTLEGNGTEYNIRGRIANGKITAEFYSFLDSKDNKGIAELQLINSKIIENGRSSKLHNLHFIFQNIPNSLEIMLPAAVFILEEKQLNKQIIQSLIISNDKILSVTNFQ